VLLAGNDVVIEDSVVMGADFFESEEHHNGTGADNASAQAGGATNAAGQEGSSSAEAPNMRNLTPVGIGAGSVIKKVGYTRAQPACIPYVSESLVF
jgi:hypothetical protein